MLPVSHATEPRTESAATEIAPHARAFAERARKLEALPLAELAARVAEGLAGLRVTFGLEPSAADPFAALLAALPRTELARRLAESEAEVSAARAALVESERTAADVERRSESLKAALRERSADLAVAIARADAAAKAPAPIERVEIDPEPAGDSSFTRAVVQAREQHAADAAATAQLDREALFARLDNEVHALEASRRQVRELLDELEARVPPPAVDRGRAQVEVDALLGDLAERETTIESMRRDLTWRAREMDAMHAELQSTRYRLLARAIVDRAERWVKPGRAEERP